MEIFLPTSGPQPLAVDRALFLKSASAGATIIVVGVVLHTSSFVQGFLIHNLRQFSAARKVKYFHILAELMKEYTAHIMIFWF